MAQWLSGNEKWLHRLGRGSRAGITVITGSDGLQLILPPKASSYRRQMRRRLLAHEEIMAAIAAKKAKK
jgi:hypothetical protein